MSNGKYYIVLRDSSLATFSKRNDDIQVNVKCCREVQKRYEGNKKIRLLKEKEVDD